MQLKNFCCAEAIDIWGYQQRFPRVQTKVTTLRWPFTSLQGRPGVKVWPWSLFHSSTPQKTWASTTQRVRKNTKAWPTLLFVLWWTPTSSCDSEIKTGTFGSFMNWEWIYLLLPEERGTQKTWKKGNSVYLFWFWTGTAWLWVFRNGLV